MLLAVDVGNTNILLGLFADNQLAATWRIKTDTSRTGDEYAALVTQLFQLDGFSTKDAHGIAVSCVSPGMLPPIQLMARRCFTCHPLVITGETPTPLQVLYANPKSLGADRLVNCVAAADKYGVPVIVVDLGTATTIDCVSTQGAFLGGTIAPGIATSLHALTLDAPGLPRVELKAPACAIGANTAECIQSGTVLYAAGAIDSLVRKMKQEMQASPFVVATGGLAWLMQGLSTEIQAVDDNLTLHGIRLIYESQSSLASQKL